MLQVNFVGDGTNGFKIEFVEIMTCWYIYCD